MDGGQGHAHGLVEENHQGLVAVADRGLEILGVAGEGEQLAVDGGLVDRGCEQHVDFAGLQVGDGPLKGLERGLSGLSRGVAGLYLCLLADDVDDGGLSA